MTFLGKVLIVVQVVLSLCFMAFAGAVVAIHQNWKVLYLAEQQNHTNTRNDYDLELGARADERDDLQVELDNAVDEAQRQQLLHTNASDQLAASLRDNQILEQENQRLEGEVERAGLEAAFRLEEAQQRQRENLAQQAALDAKQEENRALEDTNFGLTVALSDLEARYAALQEANARHIAILDQNGIDRDSRLEDVLAPAPPLDGRILQVELDDAGRPYMVLLSLGEDDGLTIDHVLDVYRLENGETLYVGQVKITNTWPDRAVADVIIENRNGIIEVADHVTTRL